MFAIVVCLVCVTAFPVQVTHGAAITGAAITITPEYSWTEGNMTMMDNSNETLSTNYTEIEEPNISPEEAEEVNDVSQRLLDDLESRTDPRIRPVSNKDNGPVKVYVSVHVGSISAISEVNMEYSIGIFLRQTWINKMLAYNVSRLGPGLKYIKLHKEPSKHIWVPDVFFSNGKKGAKHDITVPNEVASIYPNGTVFYSIRLALTMACLMDLKAFPLDYQECPLKIETYSYNLNNLLLIWRDDPIELAGSLSLPQFDLIKPVTTKECTKHYLTGGFACLEVTFKMQRLFGFYLLQTYIPSALIVVLSWVSFWIDMEAVPARIALSVTTVMTMVAQLAGSKNSIPKVSYPKAVDVWMTTGMIFVFVALIEYAFVNSLARKSRKVAEYKKSDKLDITDEDIDPTVNYRKRARTVDKVSRVIFPLAFIIFNVLYWPLYMTMGNDSAISEE